MVGVVMVFFLGIITIIESNLAYAASSEKIPLVQKYEQFPGQEITGFCYLQYDDEGNLDWRIKVNGLVPETRGHFDLDHWAGEVDVPFTADKNGKADSKNNFIPVNHIRHSLFSQFAKCQVLISGFNDFTSPVIALGVPGASNLEAVENKTPGPIEEKFFLFAALEYVFGILMNGIVDADESKPLISPEKKPSSFLPEIDNNAETDSFAGFESIFDPLQSTTPSTADKGPADKGPADKGPADKGPADKGPADKGPADKGPADTCRQGSCRQGSCRQGSCRQSQ
jgi:hypothetical protein